VGHAHHIAVALALVPTAVRADDAAEPVAVPPFAPGAVTARAALELGDTSSLAVDGFYDVNDRFRIGATMSHAARRQLGAGRGLCIAEAGGCVDRFAGIAAEAQVRLGPSLVGRASIDAVRFAPTAVAAELGADVHWTDARFGVTVSPILRLGIARRDLANRDSGALPAQIDLQLAPRFGVTGIARVAVGFDRLDATPSFGAAGGVWLRLGPVILTARSGSTDVFHPRSTLFADLAISWSS
jgi:hypothetical protein